MSLGKLKELAPRIAVALYPASEYTTNNAARRDAEAKIDTIVESLLPEIEAEIAALKAEREDLRFTVRHLTGLFDAANADLISLKEPMACGHPKACWRVFNETNRYTGMGQYVSTELHGACTACLAVAAALREAATLAYRTPFRAHSADDVDFHSGCIQTRDRIVKAIEDSVPPNGAKALDAEPDTSDIPEVKDWSKAERKMSTRGSRNMQTRDQSINEKDIRVSIEQVFIEDRVRKLYDGIDELANSIKDLGLIQPLVLTRANRLVVGGRRLAALKKIGVKELIHNYHFLYSDEVDEYRLKAVELEENLKRKSLTWTEEILAKKQLLEIMQSIHGVARSSYPSRSDRLGITSSGFGINKLASLLGESNAQTSKDIELATLIEAVPELARADTKEAARRQAILGTAVAVAIAQGAAKSAANPQQATDRRWKLYEGDFVDNAKNIEANSVDLVIVDPPYGADVSGMGPNSKILLTKPFQDSLRPTNILLSFLAEQSFRVLKDDRFAAFFFDFILYKDLIQQLDGWGFEVDITPLIWVKNTVINTSPYTRYGRSYEPILIARKGKPKLMRPSQSDVIQIQNVITRSANETKYYHAQKPVALIEKFILDMTPPTDDCTVVDFCAGSGTTGEAALKQKRRAILFEKEHGACEIIKARLGAL